MFTDHSLRGVPQFTNCMTRFIKLRQTNLTGLERSEACLSCRESLEDLIFFFATPAVCIDSGAPPDRVYRRSREKKKGQVFDFSDTINTPQSVDFDFDFDYVRSSSAAAPHDDFDTDSVHDVYHKNRQFSAQIYNANQSVCIEVRA